jgi:hypothetical protein
MNDIEILIELVLVGWQLDEYDHRWKESAEQVRVKIPGMNYDRKLKTLSDEVLFGYYKSLSDKQYDLLENVIKVIVARELDKVHYQEFKDKENAALEEYSKRNTVKNDRT